MSASSVPPADTSNVMPNTHQAQTPSHNLAPSLPAMNPYGTPPPGVAAQGNLPAGTSSGIPNNQQGQTPSHNLPPSLSAPQAIMNPYGTPPTGVAAQGQPAAGTASGIPTHQAAQTPSNNLAPSLPVPQALMQPLGAASTGVAAPGQTTAGTSGGISNTQQAYQTLTHSLAPSPNLTSSHLAPPAVSQPPGAPDPTSPPTYLLSAKETRKLAKRLAGEPPSPEPEPSRMQYPNPAIAPETAEEHSIYPMNRQMRRDRGDNPEGETLDTFIAQMDQGLGNGDPAFDLQHQVRKMGYQLWLDKGKPMRPAAGMSETTRTLDEQSRDRSGGETSGGDPALSEKTKETSTILDESLMNWDGAGDSDEDAERDFTMFEDTPKDASLVPEREWNLPPYNEPSSPIQPASTTALSSLPTWSPTQDPEHEHEAHWNLEKWSDFRFKVPSTSSDMESLQQALEMTRMDFWIRNPYEEYPPVDQLARYKGESYGSQHRRLQHAFCRLWREFEAEGGPAAELYRLPVWTFGFEACYWRPASWGMDKRSEVYNRGLAEMAAEKDAKGLQWVDYRSWKAKLEEQDRAVMAEAETPLALFAGSKGRQ